MPRAHPEKVFEYLQTLPGTHIELFYGSVDLQLHGWSFLVESASIDDGDLVIKPVNQGPIKAIACTTVDLYESGLLIAKGGEPARPWALRVERRDG